MTVSKRVLDRISNLQDKYHYQDTFAVESAEESIDFLEGLLELSCNGLSIEQEDLDWIEETVDEYYSVLEMLGQES